MRNFWAKIQKIETITELIQFLDPKVFSLFAKFVLAYWMISPIIVLLDILEKVDNDPFTLLLNNLRRISLWQTILIQVGGLGLGLFLVRMMINLYQKRMKKALSFEIIALIAFVLWLILSWFMNGDKSFTFIGTTHRQEGLYAYLMYVGIFTLAYHINDSKQRYFLLKIFISVASFLVILSFINHESVYAFLNISSKTSVFFNQNHFAYYLALACMVAISLFILSHQKRYLIVFSILVSGLSFNTSFGPLLALIISLSFSLILLKILNKITQRRLWTIVLTFILTILITNLSTNYLLADFFRLGNDIANILKDSEDIGFAGSARWPLWVNGFEFIKQRPLFGYGLDNLGIQYALVNIKIDRPHNELIQFAASAGLASLVFYLLALISTFIKFIQKIKQLSAESLLIFFVSLTYFISSLFGNTMIYTSPYYLIFLAWIIKDVNAFKKS